MFVLKDYKKQYHIKNYKPRLKSTNCIVCNLAFHTSRKKSTCSDKCLKMHKKKYSSKYEKQRKKTDINYRLTKILRSRIWKAIKNKQKTGSAIKDLGCSISKLKIHLQLKFTRNPRNQKQIMTWENYGKWHIDHIIPLSSFNLSNASEFKKASHYTNLQPLWAEDNLKKFNSI